LLYLVGGAARSGKTIVARRLLSERQIPYFSFDYLVSGVSRGAPQLKVTHEAGSRVRGERLWPIAHPLLRNVVEVEPHYLIEGEALLPAHLSELMGEYPGQVRGCFLGYAAASVASKLAEVRRYPSPVNDWVAKLSEQSLYEVITEHRELSRYLQSECSRLDLAYIETSGKFEAALEAAFQHLVGAA